MNEAKKFIESPLNLLIFSNVLEMQIAIHRASYNFNEVVKTTLGVNDFEDLFICSNAMLKSVDENAVFITASKPRGLDNTFKHDYTSGKCTLNAPATIAFNGFPPDPETLLNFMSMTIMATYNPENGEIGGFSLPVAMGVREYFIDKINNLEEDDDDFEQETTDWFVH